MPIEPGKTSNAAAARERDYESEMREVNEALLVTAVRQHEMTEEATEAATELRENQTQLSEGRMSLAMELAAMQRLQEVSTGLIAEDDPHSLYEKILDAAMEIMRAQYASLQLLVPERGNGELWLLGYRGFSPEAARFWEWVSPASESICGMAMRTGERVIVTNVEADESMAGSKDQAVYLQTGIHAVQTTPLVSRTGQILGMISTHWSRPHQPAERDLRLLDVLARQAAELVERSLAEIALNESREHYRALFQSAPMAVFACDNNAVIQHYNERAAELWGREPECGVERHCGSMKLWLPDGTLLPHGRSPIVEVLRTGNPARNVEVFIERPDGSRLPVLVNFAALKNARGEITGAITSFVDITERRRMEETLRESEEKFRLLSEAAPALIWYDDAHGNCMYVNQQYLDFSGKTLDDMEGTGWHLVLHPDDAGDYLAEFYKAQRERRPFHHRVRVQRIDGEWRWIESYAKPLFAADGSFLGHVGVSPDITDSVEAGEKLRHAQEILEERVKERTKDLDLANTALRHEILDRRRVEHERIGLLRRIVTTQEDERRRIARDMHDQLGQRLTALRLKIASLKDACGENEELCARVERLADLAESLDSEVSFLAWELRPASLDDLGVVTAIENYVREWSAHFNIDADFHTAGLKKIRLDPEIETNLYRITQEALNNVAKHAEAERASVIIEKRKGEVVLTVEDDGIGFEPDIEAAVHESGLGLIGMRERAAIIDGLIEIESAPGKGTTIFVRAPLALWQRDD